jgi:hypothetical protein
MMHINRTTSSDVNALSQGSIFDKPAKASDNGKVYSVQTDSAGFVEKALSLSGDSSSSAIEEAKALLAAGRLDTPEAIRQAAANIALRGI